MMFSKGLRCTLLALIAIAIISAQFLEVHSQDDEDDQTSAEEQQHGSVPQEARPRSRESDNQPRVSSQGDRSRQRFRQSHNQPRNQPSGNSDEDRLRELRRRFRESRNRTWVHGQDEEYGK